MASLARSLQKVESDVRAAGLLVNSGDTEKATPLLWNALATLNEAVARVSGWDPHDAANADLLSRLKEKQEQAARAVNLALGVSLDAWMISTSHAPTKNGSGSSAATSVYPGETFLVKVHFHNGSKQAIAVSDLRIETPGNWDLVRPSDPRSLKPGDDFDVLFHVTAPSNAEISRPYWHRTQPEVESLNTVDDPQSATLPFTPSTLRATGHFVLQNGAPANAGSGRITVPVLSHFRDEDGNERTWPAPVAPLFSVLVEPGTQVISTGTENSFPVKVRVEAAAAGKGKLKLEVPDAWRVEPHDAMVTFDTSGDRATSFTVYPSPIPPGSYSIRAVLESGRDNFTDGYSLITREDLGAYYYYQPAIQKLSVVDVKVPHDLKVGYIMGAGDEIPTALQQLGVNLELIPPETVAKADLSRFSTIVLGIRAYDTQKEVVANNQRLLDYVSNGGTLIVQYNAGAGDFNSGKFTPFPAHLSRARVSVEEAPVEILSPQDSIFHFPNEISQKDFEGWVQERGLYFMDQWDEKFIPLLASNDPGEQSQKGGLLRVKYGKGTYIYTGYAFFRQLPAGVPGAVRLFVNLLAAGHEPAATH
jgi:hypothetical protein